MPQQIETERPDNEASEIDSAALHEKSPEAGTAQLREELEAERDRFLRLAAEYENYRRRTKRESETAADEGKRELLMQMLSLNDDLDMALEGLAESRESVSEGVNLIRRRFLELLEANGVVPFESLGMQFDPERHDAFDVVRADEDHSGIVHKEMRRGYFWRDRLLRPALVVVTQ